VANLPVDVAKRELQSVKDRLGWPETSLRVTRDTQAHGPGNVLHLVHRYEHLTEVFTGFGERGVRAEHVAERALEQAERFAASDAAVGEYLADQLLLPMALAGGGRFTTLEPTGHARTNMEVIRLFLPVRFRVERGEKDLWRIEVEDP
jgi:RNA 3'-terminal phosphate cyclase (ATP)